MKPAYDKLMAAYEGSSSVVVADVDCTVEQELCGEKGVRGYPTIKYYKDGDKGGKDYPSGRDFDSLNKFVQDELEVKCQVADQEGCTDKEKAFITKNSGKAGADLDKQIARLDKMKGDSMKPELKQWLFARLNILKQLKDA